MTLDDYNTHCARLPAASRVIQWGGSHVWKVGAGTSQTGKVFAVAGWSDDEALAVTFKCSDIVFEVLRDAPGCRPAPYLASRGMLWIQRTSPDSVSDDELQTHLSESWRLAALGLTKKRRAALGLA
ncbi:MAG: MmcQ/YjbR family DNA-binding protein [Oceanicaulis sp.]|nr:MmcQ/YjbR family DNA-binding protein [Oceanicaulis sp.]